MADEQTRSVWIEGHRLEGERGQPRELSTDVCIVGAGIAGLSVAYSLLQAGKRVMVLDDGPPAGGETSRTTAHLVSALDVRYCELERLHGAEGARLAAASHREAIATIEAIVQRENVDCDFARLDGYLCLAPDQSPELLDRELEAAQRAGLSGVRRVERAPFESYDTGPALRFADQAQFHVVKYVRGLLAAIERRGGRCFSDAHVESVEGGTGARVTTRGGAVVTADAVVVATGAPVNDIVTIHTKQAAYRTYVVGGVVPRDSLPRVLLWDTADPFHYVRLCRALDDRRDVLLVGGEDHKTGQANDAVGRFERLEHWTRERFPEVGEISHRWSGQVLEPVDGVAFIGRNPGDAENVYVVTGTSGNGMTYGTIAGLLLADLIVGRPNPWATLYDPARRTLRAAAEFARENLNVAAQYVDLVTPGEVRDVEQIAPGEGAVIRDGLSKMAVYRDDTGTLHRRSALCPHLGCVVHWNSTERTWDCPCHGSRFRGDGVVVNGPAISDLAAVED